MIKTKDLMLLDIAAISTLEDETTKRIYESIDYVLVKRQKIYYERFKLLQRLDIMGNFELDLLLWSFSDVRNSVSTEEKRMLVRNALLSRISKGTIGSLQQVCSILYEGFKVEEWYLYGGKPGTFRIFADKQIRDPKEYSELIKAIYANKNVRSHLDTIFYPRSSKNKIFIGGYKIVNIIDKKENRKKDFVITNNLIITSYRQTIGVIKNEI